ncbi:Alpha/Beta hydrolase protein [Xylariaceae sp. FL0016]|nr:Alpha/Beta hydrolase protein [Xylariaceae sp. FL0016]
MEEDATQSRTAASVRSDGASSRSRRASHAPSCSSKTTARTTASGLTNIPTSQTAESDGTTLSRGCSKVDGNSDEMYFASLNSLAPVSVVMLHIVLSSHLDWLHMSPLLTEYHLLLPDLPEHSRSRHIKPFTFETAADHVAQMIRDHAHDGRAHLVGLSTGSYVALEIVRRHPDVVLSVFASGMAVQNSVWNRLASYPRVTTLGLSAVFRAPTNSLLKGLGWSPELQSEKLVDELRRNISLSVMEASCQVFKRWKKDPALMDAVGRQDKRIALVAGAKQDDVELTQRFGRALASMGMGPGRDSQMFVVQDAIHSWNLQMPKAFARGVRAWIEGGRYMPPEFEALDIR